MYHAENKSRLYRATFKADVQIFLDESPEYCCLRLKSWDS